MDSHAVDVSLDHIIPIMMRYVRGEIFEKNDVMLELNEDIKSKENERKGTFEQFFHTKGDDFVDYPGIDEKDFQYNKVEEYRLYRYIFIDTLEHSLKVSYLLSYMPLLVLYRTRETKYRFASGCLKI